MWDVIPQLVSTVSLKDWYGTAVRTIPYLFFSAVEMHVVTLQPVLRP